MPARPIRTVSARRASVYRKRGFHVAFHSLTKNGKPRYAVLDYHDDSDARIAHDERVEDLNRGRR